MTTRTLDRMRDAVPFLRWLAESRFAKKQREDGIADLMFGNPQEMPLPAYVGALMAQVAPRDKAWFAYKLSEPGSVEVVAPRAGPGFLPMPWGYPFPQGWRKNFAQTGFRPLVEKTGTKAQRRAS